MTADSTTSPSPSQLDPFRIAAGMLRADTLLVAPLLILLSLTTLASVFVPLETFSSVLALFVTDRAIQLVVISMIALRWSKRFESHGRSQHPRIVTARRITLFGFGIWCVLSLPRLLSDYAPDERIQSALLASLCVGIFLSLRYYFFFAITALLGKTIKSSAQAALEIAKRRPQAALRSLLGPFGITATLTVAIFALQPDGRSLWVNACAASTEAIFWLLSTYTALAFAAVLIDDYDWRAAGLDPYRSDRLKTLEAQGKGWIATLLSPATGIKLLAVSLLLLFASLARDQRTPPAASITVKTVEVSDYKIKVTLEVSDTAYLFRGFKPAAFSVLTKSETQIAEELTKASLSADKDETILFMPTSDGSPRNLYVEFRSMKSRENLLAIDYAWLWYQRVPLMPLPLSGKAGDEAKEPLTAIPEVAPPQP